MSVFSKFKPAKIFLQKTYAGKPISISLSPNVEKDDLHLALNLIIRPWLWKKGKAIKELEKRAKRKIATNNDYDEFKKTIMSLPL